MKKSKYRAIAIVIFLLVTLYYLAPVLISERPSFISEKIWPEKMKLGLDLQGGSQIDLYVDLTNVPQKEQDSAVKTALEVIRNRVDYFGVAEPSIQLVGKNKIVIQLPGLKDSERAKDLIGKTALLEFKLLLQEDEAKQLVNKLDAYMAKNLAKHNFKDLKAETPTANNLIKAKSDSLKADSLSIDDKEKYFSMIINSGVEPYSVSSNYKEDFVKLLADTSFTNNIPSGYQILMGKEDTQDPNGDVPVYFLYNRAELEGKYLNEATVRISSQNDFKNANQPYISLKFNREGSRIFERVTGANVNRRLAIVLDNTVYVAPNIADRIRGGEAQITGKFTLEECNDLVIVLKAGNLPAPVNIGKTSSIGPSLGADSIHSGLMAGLIGALLVVLFMIIYYQLSGIIATIALALNIGFIFAALTFFNATLTLPGIAGIILTIGMAVDANVLIFERIREELRAGKTVRNAVDNGFNRATVTILDSNITTLITAAILYQFGTGAIRGFAVTLSIGIISSMFTAIIVSNAIYDNFITNKNRDKLSI